MAGLVMTFAELARAAQLAPTGKGALALPAVAPLDATTGRELAQILVSDIKRRFQTGTAPDGTPWKPLRYARPSGGNQPLRNTGALMASITGAFVAGFVVVSTNHPGAALHNAGGTVVPRKGTFLAIPLTVQAVRAGSPRNMPRPGIIHRIAGVLGLRSRPPLFARRVNGQLVGHFLLVRKVTVTKREFLGVSDQGWGAVAGALGEHAARTWQGS